ncbi:MAG: hypothetical protein IKK82_00440 [Kiritimatiellae bacterium]|nr:hypothetical protein [Kiritimatiellia bacterium]
MDAGAQGAVPDSTLHRAEVLDAVVEDRRRMRAAVEHADQRLGKAFHGRLLPAQKVHHVVLQRGDAFGPQLIVGGGEVVQQRGGILLLQIALSKNT